MEKLPFQPDEEQCLLDIMQTAEDFRNFIQPICNPISVSPEEVTTLRFYLRKVEGADILLSYETNFLRQELHRLAPVADRPPPVIEHSGSTRKPRPTKMQKLMAKFGVTDPEDLPEEHKQRPAVKRKYMEALEKTDKRRPDIPLKPAGYGSSSFGNASSPGTPATPHQPQPQPGQGMPRLTYSNNEARPGPYRDAPLFSHGSSFARGTSSDNTSSTPGGNLDPALFGAGPSPSSGTGFERSPGGLGGGLSNSSPNNNKELEDKVFADMVQDQDEGELEGKASSAAALASEALRNAVGGEGD